MIGEAKWDKDFDKMKSMAVEILIPFLAYDSFPVRFQTAIALGKLKATESVDPLVAMIEANNNADVMLRHAGVMGLTGAASVEQLVGLGDHASPAVRLAAVLALRRKAAPEISRFLTDADPFVVEETSRAIYDLPIPAALPALADRISQPQFSNDELARRILYANFRLGSEANANAVAKFSTREMISVPLQLEAVHLLADWTTPSAKDRLLNIWRPLPTRPASIGTEALRSALPGLLTSSDAIRAAAAETAAALGLREVGPELHKQFADQARPAAARVAAFQALVGLPGEDRAVLTELALKDEAPAVRAVGLKLLATASPAAAFPQLEQAIEKGSQPERQAALASLAALDESQVAPEKIDALLQAWLDKLIAGEVPPEIQLDLITASELRTAASLKERLATYRATLPQDDPMIAFRPALAGGDAERGAAIFFQRAQLSCVRCHVVGDKGGLVGPELSKIGGEKNREYLLEAIVDPNKTIAKGFQSETVLLDDGRVVGGVIKDENETTLRLMSPDGRLMTIEKSTIDERQSAKSPMPEDFAKNTTLADLRDLVEFLSSLKAKP
jgi:quinoprotein glucose dehydrogenase